MFASASLIPELEEVVQHGSQDKRAKMLKRIANLFVDGSPHFNEEHVGLFDDVLCRLVGRDRGQGARRNVPDAGAGQQCASRVDAAARPRRGHRGRRPGAHEIAAAQGNRSGRDRPDQGPGSSRRHRRPLRHRRGGHRRVGAARRQRRRSQRRPQSHRQAVGERVLRAGPARRRRRRSGREGRPAP